MAHDRQIDDQDLTEADRIIIGLYDRSREPIAWDDSDDRILAFARDSRAGGHGAAAADSSESDATTADGDDNVVPFAPRRQSFVSRMIHSPATGFAMAASLMVGLFVGQGLTPLVDLGVAPGYEDLVKENQRLKAEVSTPQPKTRGLSVSPEPSNGKVSPVKPSDTLSLTDLSGALEGYGCASLEASVIRGNTIQVTGFVSTARELTQLKERLATLPRQMSIVNQARVLEQPFCGALGVLISTGGLATAQDRLPIVRPYDHGSSYKEGQQLVVEAAASTAYDGHIYVDLIQHDGNVVHLLWSADRMGRNVSAGQQVLLGTTGPTFTIVPPFGREMLIAVSSPVSLFDGPRPQVEKAEDYLKDLKAAMSRVPGGRQQVVSNYHFIETGPAN